MSVFLLIMCHMRPCELHYYTLYYTFYDHFKLNDTKRILQHLRWYLSITFLKPIGREIDRMALFPTVGTLHKY